MKFFCTTPHQIVWNPETSKRLCQFVGGYYETKDKDVIEILKKTPGVSEFTGDIPVNLEPAPDPASEEDQGIDLSSMKVKELEAYAEEHEIELDPALKKKDDIVMAILEAETNPDSIG